MRYTYKCDLCNELREISCPMGEQPKEIECKNKHGKKVVWMRRHWQSDIPMIDTSACRDANFIPHEKRVASAFDRGSENQIEAAFAQHIHDRRTEIADAGGQRGSIQQTHAIPAHLFHGKIKETGDKQYWDDPNNLNKHKECKVQ